MQTVTNKQIYDRWEQIPEVLREAFASTDNGEIIWKACQEVGLSDEVIDNVLIVAGNVLFGFTHVNEIAKELQSIPGMDPKAVDPIIFQIDRKIFAPIKGDILKLYSELSGTGPRIVAEAAPRGIGQGLPGAEFANQQPKMFTEGATVPTGAGGPMAAQASQFETRKVKIEETESSASKIGEQSFEAPAMIHEEKAVVPVIAKKRELSSFGGMFGFHRKSSQQDEGPVVAAQVNMVQGLGKRQEEIGHTEQQQAKVVHYTSAQGPEDMFGQMKQRVQQDAVATTPVTNPTNTFEPKVITLGENQIPGNSALNQQKEIPAPQVTAAVIPTAQPQQLSRATEVMPPVVVMKTPQRPEPIIGAAPQTPEPRLTEIPVADDIVDLRTLERGGSD